MIKRQWMSRENLVLTAATLALSLPLAACGGNHKGYVAQSNLHVEHRDSVAESKTAPTTEAWKQVTNFAQSIEGVNFAYNSATHSARLGFQFINLDDVDDKGVPYLTHVFELRGSVSSNGSATLTDPRAPDYIATVKCPDNRCAKAEIELSKLTGSRTNGKATLRVLRNVQAQGIVGHGEIKSAESARAQAATELKQGKHKAYVTFTEVEGGRANLFDITFKFSNAQINPNSPEYFERKEVVVSGPVGKGVMVNVAVASQLGGITSHNSDTVKADVQFDSAHSSVAVQFAETDGMSFITAGQDTKSKQKD